MAATLIASAKREEASPDLENAAHDANLRGYAFNRHSLALFHRYASDILERAPEGTLPNKPAPPEELTLSGEVQNFLHVHGIKSLAQLRTLIDQLSKKTA